MPPTPHAPQPRAGCKHRHGALACLRPTSFRYSSSVSLQHMHVGAWLRHRPGGGRHMQERCFGDGHISRPTTGPGVHGTMQQACPAWTRPAAGSCAARPAHLPAPSTACLVPLMYDTISCREQGRGAVSPSLPRPQSSRECSLQWRACGARACLPGQPRVEVHLVPLLGGQVPQQATEHGALRDGDARNQGGVHASQKPC